MKSFEVRVKGFPPFRAPAGAKLALAIEKAGYDISHRCGGHAKCTTCRVRFDSAAPDMGERERRRLEEDGLNGQMRLACQIRIEQDMDLEVLLPVHDAEWDNPGIPLEP